MIKQLHDVEFETRTIVVVTTPVIERLKFREIVNFYCPIAKQILISWSGGRILNPVAT